MPSISLTDLPTDIQQNLSTKALEKGEILFQQGDTAKFVYLVTSGHMRLVTFVKNQIVTHYFVDAGELLGESALYMPTYGCTAIIETDSEFAVIPVDDFSVALRTNAALSELYRAHMTHRFYGMKALLELRSIYSSRDRLLHYLMPRLAPGQFTITLDKPLKVIASELALTPETLSRLLSRLEEEGAISRQRRAITFSPTWLEDVAKY